MHSGTPSKINKIFQNYINIGVKENSSAVMDNPTEISQQAKIRHSILSENGALKYDFMTSLQKIAMARIMSTLWINENTQQQIVNLFRHHKMMMWSAFDKIEDNIVAKVLQLSLPKPICQELKCLVPLLENFIVNWINYHDEYILIPEKSEYSAVDLIHKIVWTARGKIDYVKTAKNILRNSGIYLSDDHKYKIACNYCLEDEVSLLSSKLVNNLFLSYIKIDREPMVYFWTAKITGDMTQLNNPQYCWEINRRNDTTSINEHIMQLLIKNYGTIRNKTINDVPIRFMWSKLSKEEKAKNIALFKNVKNPDFIISFLSNLDYDQQQAFLKEHSDAVLFAILNEWWWWESYFLPTALNVLDIMDPLSFWRVLRELNRKKSMSSEKNMYDHFKSLFKLLWKESSTQLKEFIFHDRVKSLDEFVIYELDWEQDVDVIEAIFEDLNTQQKKNIAFGQDGIERCVYFILYDKWDSLDFFMKCTLFSEDDKSQLKQSIMQDNGKRLAISFLRQREFHKMERFVNWAFKSEEDIANFRQSLNHP